MLQIAVRPGGMASELHQSLGATPARPRLRLLCLHGMGTNSNILRRQLQPLLLATQSDAVDFHFLDGHDHCPPADATVAKVFAGEQCRRYMERVRVDGGDEFAYTGIDCAVQAVLQQLHDHGPYDGLLGFSQGANLATMVAAQLLNGQQGPGEPSRPPCPRFCILMCGTEFGWATKQLGHLFRGQPLPLPSCHIIGDMDPFKVTTEALAQLWKDPQMHRHPSGHRPLPPGKDAEQLVSALRAFLMAHAVPLE